MKPLSNKIKFSVGGAVKPSKWTINVISNIKSQLHREENLISVGDKVKGSFELTTDIQPELRKVGNTTDDFETLKDGDVVLNKRTQINDDDWTLSTRPEQVDMIGKPVNGVPQIQPTTQDGLNRINVTDKLKPSLLKALYPVRKLINAVIPVGNILKKVSVKVIACNEQGENETTPTLTLYKPKIDNWTYIVAGNKVAMGWTDTTPVDGQYKVRYKIDEGEYQYATLEGDLTATGKKYTYEIPLLETQSVEVSICIVDDKQDHIYSNPITMSKANDVNLKPPTGFTYEWVSKNELKLKWNDIYTVDDDYELLYAIDSGEEISVIVPTKSKPNATDILEHTITLTELQTVVARVRMRWHMNNSEFATQTVLHNLARPENIRFEIVKEGTKVSWDASPLAESYKVYIEGKELANVTTTSTVITEELNGDVYVVAHKQHFISDPSDPIFIKSKPNHPVNINAKFEETIDGYTFNVSFMDNSAVESSYRMEYSVDGGTTEIMTINSTEYEQGTVVTFTFTTPDITDHISIRVISINELGENDMAEPINIYVSPQPRWSYLVTPRQIILDWEDKFDFETGYKIQYRVNGLDYVYDTVDSSEVQLGGRVQYRFPLGLFDTATVRICCVSKQDHFYSKPIAVSRDRDTTIIPPPDFKHRWTGNGGVEFSWLDDYKVENGFEFTYRINDGQEITDWIPTESKEGSQVYKVSKQLNDGDRMDAKVRMVWDINQSEYDSISIIYLPTEATPIKGLCRERTDAGAKIMWQPQAGVEKYIMTYQRSGSEPTVIETQDDWHFLEFDYKDNREIMIYVQALMSGGTISPIEERMIFVPFEDVYSVFTEIYTNCKDGYHVNQVVYFEGTKLSVPINQIFATDTICKAFINQISMNPFTMSKYDIFSEVSNVGYKQSYDIDSRISNYNLLFGKHGLSQVFSNKIKDVYNIWNNIYTVNRNKYPINMIITKPRIATLGDSITAGR